MYRRGKPPGGGFIDFELSIKKNLGPEKMTLLIPIG